MIAFLSVKGVRTEARTAGIAYAQYIIQDTKPLTCFTVLPNAETELTSTTRSGNDYIQCETPDTFKELYSVK